tara:strand:- start:303 stop:1232 length:930 start_codon:yes stop_codon:yes gene_type:complete
MSRVTFGIVNYNRLFYLKSCAETLMESVSDYDDVEFICVDDNSKESGTKEYLKTLQDRGWIVINQEEHRNKEKSKVDFYNDTVHMNAFSDALNIILDKATGEIFAPLQGDMQFVKKNWLESYVELFEERDDVGSVGLDAQRRIRLEGSYFTNTIETENNIFAIDRSRNIAGAGDVCYRTSIVKEIGGWTHGKAGTPETHFVQKINNMYNGSMKAYMPWNPPSALIITGMGTNARIRGGKRYGAYWEAKSDNLYYSWAEELELTKNRITPQSIEELLVTNGGWNLPFDKDDNMIKVGIDVDKDDYEVIEE